MGEKLTAPQFVPSKVEYPSQVRASAPSIGTVANSVPPLVRLRSSIKLAKPAGIATIKRRLSPAIAEVFCSVTVAVPVKAVTLTRCVR